MDIEKINNLIIGYQNSGQVSILNQIIKEISIMIYNYPLKVHALKEDDCSEFYIYIIERIDTILMKYKIQLSSFKTWFSIVLKSHFLNWINKKNKISSNSVKTFSIDDENLNQDFLFSKIESNPETDDKFMQIINNYINQLPNIDFLIIRLLYFNIDDELIKILSKTNGNNERINMDIIKSYLNNNKKFKTQYILNDKITNCNHKLYELKIKNNKTQNFSQQHTKLIKKIQFYKNKLYNNLENFDIVFIAQILNIPKNEIYYRLNRIKKEIYNKINTIL